MNNQTAIVVLNDGETYTSVPGCRVTMVDTIDVDADTVDLALDELRDEPLAFFARDHEGNLVIELTDFARKTGAVRVVP